MDASTGPYLTCWVPSRIGRKVTGVIIYILKEGKRVLVRNVHLRSKHNLADRWESNVYAILRQSGDLPVYVMRPETGEGPQRKCNKYSIKCKYNK